MQYHFLCLRTIYMYKTLDQWFGTTDGSSVPVQKTVFYFDSNTMESKWLFDIPKKITYKTIVKWNHVPIIVCTNLSQDHSFTIPKDKKYNVKQISFFKSNLQKCIRRKLNDKAIMTAYHMIKLDICEFLRRLTIIVFEDVKLHSSYSVLVWLMAALSTKEVFKPTKYIVDWLLGLVNTLCDINDYDEIGYENDKDKYKNNIPDFNDYDLIYSVLFRVSYGGMFYDVNMLNYFVGVWYKRFKNGDKCNKDMIKIIDSTKIKSMIQDDWKLDGDNMAGIDFHCYPPFLEILAKEYNYPEKEIKTTIWNCSSGINHRKTIEPTNNDMEIWEKIKERYFELQNGVFNKYLKGF